MSWLTGWSNRIAFEISNASITEDVTDFPILVYLSQHSGICSYNMQEVFDDLGDNSRKIAITTSDGTTQCYVEVEQWSYVNKKAYLWVRIPTVSATSINKFYLYWDKDQSNNTTYVGVPASVPGKAVWNTEYLAVYHMTSASTLVDSTSNARNITVTGNPTLVDTMLGKGITFNGSSQYAEANLSLIGSHIEDSFIIDTFSYPSASQSCLFCEAPTSYSGYNSSIYSLFPSTFGIELSVTGTSSSNTVRKQNTGSIISTGTAWHMSAAKYRISGADHGKILINGFERFSYSAIDTEQVVSGSDTGRVSIGRYRIFVSGTETIGGYFNGTIMDVRILSGTKTDSWYRLNDDSYYDRIITWHPEVRRRIIIDHTMVEHDGPHQMLICLNDEHFQNRCDPGLKYKDVIFFDANGNILDSVPSGLDSRFPAISRDYQWQPKDYPPLTKTGWPLVGRGVTGDYDNYQIITPCVIKDGTTYRMWYGAYDYTHYRIKYATSINGTDWVKYGVVLTYGGTYDSYHTTSPCVIKDGTTYKMWYSGHNGSVYAYICYATSTDGITWTKAGSPCLTYGGTYDSTYLSNPCVIKVSDTDYRMWYDGSDGTNRRVLYATSADGITWTKVGISIAPSSAGVYTYDSLNTHAPWVIKESDDEYLMWYTGEVTASENRILTARSKDGVTWSKNWLPPSNVVLDINASNSYENLGAGFARIFKDTEGYKIYYGGRITGMYNCFMARSAFEKYWYVRVPSVSSTQDTEIFVVYGSPYWHNYSHSQNVFPYQDGFVGAYLMDREPTSGSPSTSDYCEDLSITKNHGQFYGMSWANHWPAKATRGYCFGSGQYITLGTSSAMRQLSCIGYSFLICLSGNANFYTGCGCSTGHGYGGIEINRSAGQVRYHWTPTTPEANNYVYADVTLPDGKWLLINIFVDFTNKVAKLFINDTKYTMTISSSATNWTPVSSYNSGYTDMIGARSVNGSTYYSNNHIIANFQILNQYKDDGWVYTKYNNLFNISAFNRVTNEIDDEWIWNNTITRQTTYKYFPLQCREWKCYSNASYNPNFNFYNWLSGLKIYSSTSSMGCGTAFVSFPITELKGRSISLQLLKTGYANSWLYIQIYDGQYDCSNDADFPDGTVDNQNFITKGNGRFESINVLGISIGSYSNLIDLDRYTDKCSTGYLTIAILIIDAWNSYELGATIQRFQIIERDGSEYMSADLSGKESIYDNDFTDSTVGSYPLHFVTPDPGSSYVVTVLDSLTNSNAVEFKNDPSMITIYDQYANFGYNMCAYLNVRYVGGTSYNRWAIRFINDSSNLVMVGCIYGNDVIDIYETVGGTTTRRAYSSISYGTTWHSIFITIYGSAINVQIDDTQIYYGSLSVTSFKDIRLSTWAGSINRYDNIIIGNPLTMGRLSTYNDYGTYGSLRGTPYSSYKLIYGDDFNTNQYRWDIYSGTSPTPLWNIIDHPLDIEKKCIRCTGSSSYADYLIKYLPHLTNCLITFKVMYSSTSSNWYPWYSVEGGVGIYILYGESSSLKWKFNYNSTAYAFPNNHLTWTSNVWYQVTLKLTQSNKYKIWINEYYLGEVNWSVAPETQKIWSINRYSTIRSSVNSQYTYLSDIKVYDLNHTVGTDNPVYTLSGNTKELGTLVSRQVNTYDRDSGELINHQLSTAATVGFEIITLNNSDDHYVIALDDDTSPSYNALIFDYLKGSE